MDRVKAAIQNELRDLKPADRVKAMRALVQFVADEYARVIIRAGQEQRWEAQAKRNKKSFYYYPSLKPKPTAEEILAMSREEGFKYQQLCRLYGYEYWLISDTRFLDDGRSSQFYKMFQELVPYGDEKDREAQKREYMVRSEHSWAEVKYEITTQEILDYGEKVKSGQIAYEVNSHGYRSQLSPLHMLEFEIDGQKWPSLEHYMLAQQFEDIAFQDEIRTTRTITQIRKLIKGRPARPDWDAVRDGVMTKALEVKFADRYLKALLLSTHGFSIQVKHADPYWGAPRNRAGELMAELRERMFAVQENRMLVGLFKGTEYEKAEE